MKLSLKQVGPSAIAQTQKFVKRMESNRESLLKRVGYLGRQQMQKTLSHPGTPDNRSRSPQPPFKQSGRLLRSVRYETDGSSVHVFPAQRGRTFYGDVLQFGIAKPGKFRRPKKFAIGMEGIVAIRDGRAIFARLRTPKQVEAANRNVRILFGNDGKRLAKTAHIDIGNKRLLERYEKLVQIDRRDFVTPTRRAMEPEVQKLLRKLVY